ncbi:hypothetical protein HQ520_06655 [bacterium]|nr:hypothetical protein [bacterium]
MKRLLPICLTFAAVVLLFHAATPGHATPPKRILIGYEPTSNTLQVNVIHPVPRLALWMHRIVKVEVYLNEKMIAAGVFEGQTDKNGLRSEFTLKEKVKPGDQIRVWAECNLWGTKENTLKIELTPDQKAARKKEVLREMLRVEKEKQARGQELLKSMEEKEPTKENAPQKTNEAPTE